MTPPPSPQALNRCHRIGQTRDVTCTTYYCPGTVEERLLAYRAAESEARCAEIAREVDRDKDHRASLCVTHVCARVQAAGGAVAGRGDSGEAEEAAVALLATSVEQARPDPHLILPPGYSADTI